MPLGSSAGAAEEPLSLRRLRESLSNLEQLEKKRHELRDRFEAPGGLGDKPTGEREPESYGGLGGSRSAISRISSASPRLRSSSPRNLGLGNRGGTAGTGSFSSERDPAFWEPATRDTAGQDYAAAAADAMPPRASSSLRASGGAGERGSSMYSKQQPRDSALALALERSQDLIDALQRDRDEAVRRADEQEVEVNRLVIRVERAEAGHRAALEERQHELSDVQRLRREHRDALDQLASLRAEVAQSRHESEDMRSRLERMVTDQRQQIDELEEAGNRAERELQERSTRSSDVETALYTCLQERTALLQFLVDLLTALQTLFYDPTPFARLRLPQQGSQSQSPPPAGAGAAGWIQSSGGAAQQGRQRSRCYSREHRHSGCYACGPTGPHPGHTGWTQRTGASPEPGLKEAASGAEDLRDLCASLEAEIAQASQSFSDQVQRVVLEAEQSARAVNAAPQQPSLQQQFRACAAWVEQERRRREKQGLPPDRAVPAVDWSEERARYQTTTRSMETKFAQLAKLRRLLQARYVAARKRAQAGRY
eukprot:TRINITY_DN8761_c1_g1_i1.p1 TRINITY_DN8761_c1_g1~~TRINITY_DN8761_c1_g1_i1.p1  ORF type:complete len:540 (+),score=112.54 TRINITY_DN8761_c1_g1_i1:31-1650(+)